MGTKFYLVGEVGEVGEKAFSARDTLAARAVTGVSGVNGLKKTVPLLILKDSSVVPQHGIVPSQIKQEGLSDDRRRYLFHEIRQYCKSGTEDLVAPAP